jgi:hypothetical protein
MLSRGLGTGPLRGSSFVHRLKAALNRHLHYHCCILDGVFEPLEAGGVQFREALALTPETVATIEAQVRRRVLHWFSRHGLLDPDDARDMLAWDNSGFSLDASVRIAGHDRPGLERLLRYCARPPFALERRQTGQRGADRLSFAETTARRAHRAVPHPAGAHRSPRRPA